MLKVLLIVLAVAAPVLTVEQPGFLTVDQSAFPLTSEMTIGSLTNEYAEALYLNDMYFVSGAFSSLSSISLLNLLKNKTAPSLMQINGQPAMIYLFTVEEIPSPIINSDDIHGYLVVSISGGQYAQYFARKTNGSDLFTIQPEQCGTISANEYDLDLLRGFHFASVAESAYSMPQESVMYCMKNVDMPFNLPFDLTGARAVALYLDPSNYNGRLASVFFQGNIGGNFSYQLNRDGLGVELPQDFEYYCGQAIGYCPPDSSFEACNQLNNMCVNGGGGCKLSAMISNAKILGLDSLIPASLKSVYSFRDDFLAPSEKGREYVKKWYVFSSNLKLVNYDDIPGSIQRITEYFSLLSVINEKIDVLMSSGHDDDVLLDENTMQRLQVQINAHKGLSSELDTALLGLNEDLKFLKGKPKSAVVSYFSYP